MRDIIEQSLRLPSTAVRGDHDLNPGQRPPDRPLTPAAVLVPIVDRGEGMTVLLTKRTDHLNDHAGQVSFPGGKSEPEDPDAVATALREAEEEIGLTRDFVQVIGHLDTYITRTGFSVSPVVGIVRPGFTLTIDTFEVAEAFEVPLAFLLDARNHQRHAREYQGTMRQFWAMPYDRFYIWGATAGMLRNLYNRVQSR